MKLKKMFLLLLTTAALIPCISIHTYAAVHMEHSIAGSSGTNSFTPNESINDDSYSYADSQSVQAAGNSDPNAKGDVPIDQEHFPDRYFREYLSRPERDKNQDGVLQSGEIAAIKTVDPDDPEHPFPDMRGYQYLTAAEKLSLVIWAKPSETINLDFSALPDLKNLKVYVHSDYGTTVVNMDLSKNSQLQALETGCTINTIRLPEVCGITEYSACCIYNRDSSYTTCPHNNALLLEIIQQMPKLEFLTIKSFDEVNIDFPFCPRLKELSLIGDPDPNSASDEGIMIPPLKIASFHLSQNPELRALYLQHAILPQDTIDLSGCIYLNKITANDVRSAGKNDFTFFGLEQSTLSDVSFKHRTYIDMLPNGYYDLKDIPTWNPDRLICMKGGEIIDSRLYLHDNYEAPFDEYYNNAFDSYCDAYIEYYLNDQKSARARCYISATNDDDIPQMVSGVKVTAKTHSSLTCKWEPAGGTYDGYILYIQESATGKNIKRIKIKKRAASKKITGLHPGQRYQVSVRTYKKNYKGVNYYSPYYSSTVNCYTIPKTPSLKASVKSRRRVQMKWTASPASYRDGDSGYILYYRKGVKGTYKRLNVVPDTVAYCMTGSLKKGSTYYFKIRSYIRDKDIFYRDSADRTFGT